MAFTGIAALVAAETVTATLVLGAIANVGMLMTVVGTVTGNQKLLKFGGAMSLVGGVGGMIAGAANGAAGAAAAEGIAGAGADAATSAAWTEGAAGLGQDTLGSMGMDAATEGIASGVANSGMPNIGAATNGPEMGLSGNTMAQTGTPSASAAAATSAPTVNDVPGATGPAGVEAPAGAQGPSSPYDNPTDQRLASNMQRTPDSFNAPQSSNSFFGSMGSWAEKNKTLFQTGTNFVTGAFKGANDRAMWNERMGLERDALALRSHGNKVARFQPGIIAGASA